MDTMIIRLFRKTYTTALTALLLAGFAGANTASAAYRKDVVSDMALIYQGGTHRPQWTEDELRPYVVHTFADGHTDWFFDSFLFFEFTNNWQVAFGSDYGTRNARKSDWEWLLNRIFEKGKSLDALNSCIERYKTIIGEPPFKHKIVLGLVSPITGQSDWGSLDGVALDFSIRNHQVKAAKWYIDQLTERFNEGAYSNLELIGFYWLEESTAKCGDLPKDISQYIHQQDKRFYWIPYWNAQGYNLWRSLGFDTAFLQPNHFFNKTITDDRLDAACRAANRFGLGLEMEFDSNVLYEKEDSYFSRLESYINAFEAHGVFEQSSIAYYSGTKGILDMYRSPAIENTLILDRIAHHVSDRRSRGVGMEATDRQQREVTVTGGIGEIFVSGTPESVRIYTPNGVLVGQNVRRWQCPPGVYIVEVDQEVKKVLVR